MLSLLKSLKLNKIGRIALSSLLAVAVLCSTLSMITLIPVSAVSIWDGRKTEPTKGSGTQADPYEISNGTSFLLIKKMIYFINIKNGGFHEREGKNRVSVGYE